MNRYASSVPITRRELTSRFGRFVDNGGASLFVGAGLSAGRGLPDWDSLLKPLRKLANIPKMADFPLMAEYLATDATVGRQRLETHLWKQTVEHGFSPGNGHKLLSQIPVQQIWTTNYDTLIEDADPGTPIVSLDDAIQTVGWNNRTIIKMHGHPLVGSDATWVDPPVISRTDFENYAYNKPRTWALLNAAYLSQCILFLGFSFSDPNIELLLRLARRRGTASNDRHVTVLRRPESPADLRRHQLTVSDLENTGVSVHEIDDYSELDDILGLIVRRTRPARLFVAGSHKNESVIVNIIEQIAIAMAGHADWEMSSLGGPAAWTLAKRLATSRKANMSYDPETIKLFFKKSNGSAPVLDSRVGTAVYSNLDREDLARQTIDSCRALLVVGGGDRTAEEVAWARQMGVPVIPVGATGGVAATAWEAAVDRGSFVGEVIPSNTWAELNEEPGACHGTMTLLERAMER